MPDTQHKRVGRKSKGDRHTFGVRLPRSLANQVIAEAQRMEASYSDTLAYFIARGMGESPAEPGAGPGPRTEQRELPLTRSA